MVKKAYFAIAGVLWASSTSPAAAEATLVLQSIGPWNVEYAPESCVLARAFRASDGPVYLRMEQFQAGPHFEVSVVGSPLRSRKVTEDIEVAWGEAPGLEPITAEALFGETSDDVPAFNFPLSLRQVAGGDPNDGSDLAQSEISSLSDLRLSSGRGGRQIVLKTGPLTDALGALKVCVAKLLARWGVDPAKQSTLSQRVVPVDAHTWIRPDDYPTSGLQAGRSANVHFRVSVDTKGRVAACAVQSATDGVEFARKTCTVIARRARFKPALDSAGTPVPSYYVNTLRWLIGGADRPSRYSAQVFDDTH